MWCEVESEQTGGRPPNINYGKGYPARMIRTKDFLYIRNYEPDRWPAGTYRIKTNEGHYGDIDASPTKVVMIKQAKDLHARLFALAFGKRPREELYDCRKDPFQLRNLASSAESKVILAKLSDRLTRHLKATGDPRETVGESPWDAWQYHGRKNWPILPKPTSDTEPNLE